MGRRTVVTALGLCTLAAIAWHRALHRPTGVQMTAAAAPSVALPPSAAPPTFEVLSTLDGPILDLGYGFEVTPPSAFTIEKLDKHAYRFSVDAEGVVGVASARAATDKKLHDDPLDGARALAKDQGTTITTFETTATGNYVQFDGAFQGLPMRQHLIVTRTDTGRLAVWIILLGSAVNSPGAKRLLEELRTGGRIATR